MTTTGTEIVARVSRLFGDTNKIVVIDADYINFINDAQLVIARSTECLTTIVTPAASAFPYALPADFMKIKRVVYGQVPLDMIQIEDLDTRAVDLTYRNTPDFFYIRNRQINLFPLQASSDSTVVTIDYANIPVAISALANSLTLPDIYREDVVNFVLAKCHERNENFRSQQAVEEKLAASMAKGREDEYEKDDTYPIVRDDPIDTWMW
jgi:hypothetical protein